MGVEEPEEPLRIALPGLPDPGSNRQLDVAVFVVNEASGDPKRVLLLA